MCVLPRTDLDPDVLDRYAKDSNYTCFMDEDSVTTDEMESWGALFARRQLEPLPVYGMQRRDRDKFATRVVVIVSAGGAALAHTSGTTRM